MSTLSQIRWNLAKSPLRVPLTWYRHLGLEPHDAFLAGYPRSGTTWSRFMLYEIFTGRASSFEVVNRELPESQGKGTALRPLPGGSRFLKTHERYRPEYRKAVYIARDVRSVVVSEYHYLTMKRYIPEQEFGIFLDRFLEHRVDGCGPWTVHVDSWLDAAAAGRVELLQIRYEDLLKETAEVLGRVVGFLGFEATPGRIEWAIANNSKKAMRKKEDDARKTIYKYFRDDIRFVREAAAEGWRDKLSATDVERIERRAGDQLTRLGYRLYTR